MNTFSQTCKTTLNSVAVIGAGLAGLSCARMLADAGLSVTVLEKSRGVGGRMSTRRAENFQCDHGAQFFTARDPEFLAEVDRWLSAGVAQPWQALIRSIQQDNITHVDNKATRRFTGVPGMNAPLHWISQGLDIHTSTLVTGITHEKSFWQLECTRNNACMTQHFDAIVLAIPSPQAALLVPDSLPDIRTHCEQHSMYACWAVMLLFHQRLPVDFDAAFVNDGPLRWIARNNSKPGRPDTEVWLLHASRAWSERYLEYPSDQICNMLYREFCERTGLPANHPAPQSRSAHRWRYAQSDPVPVPPGHRWEPDGRFGLCGDWLHNDRIEGAWLSGRQLAAQILMSR